MTSAVQSRNVNVVTISSDKYTTFKPFGQDLTKKSYQRTMVPVSLAWVLRICWIRTNLEIQEHSTLCKLTPIQKHQQQIWPCHKNGHGQHWVIIWKTPQGMGIQPLGASSGSIFKLLLFPSFCTSSRKIPFASLFYMIFCCISYMYIKPQGK